MNEYFQPDELLFRAVWPKDITFKDAGRISSSAFKDPKGQGLSVDRSGERSAEEAAAFLLSHLQGVAVYVTVADCIECSALPCWKPHPANEWHSEIHQNENVKLLSQKQAYHLASKAVVFER